MEVAAKIVVKSIEVNVEGKGSVHAIIDFVIGGKVLGTRNTTRISIPLSEELRGYVVDTITNQVGEIISKEEEVEL